MLNREAECSIVASEWGTLMAFVTECHGLGIPPDVCLSHQKEVHAGNRQPPTNYSEP